MLERVASYIWGTGLLVLLLGTGLCLSFRLRFFQFWGWKTILRRTFGSLRTKSGKGGTSLTQFQTFSTALAAAMGTGNILGVAAALCLGGAGAIFWMWVSALLGMALTYSENVLALRYARTLPDGTKAGGPMAYLRFGLHSPVLAVFYSLCCIGASLGMGNMTQSSAISTLAAEAFSLPPLWTGIGVTLLLGIILLRGTRSTGKVIQWLMPVLSAVYLLAALGVIFRNAAALPAAFGQIFREAFGLHAVGGGISGAVFATCCADWSAARGIFQRSRTGEQCPCPRRRQFRRCPATGHVEHGGGGIGYAGVLHADGSGSSHQRSHDAGRQRRRHHFHRIFGRFRASRTGTDGRHHRTVCILYADRLVLLRGTGGAVSGRRSVAAALSGVVLSGGRRRGCGFPAVGVGTLRHCQRAYGSAEPAGAAASGETDRDTTRKITKGNTAQKNIPTGSTPWEYFYLQQYFKVCISMRSPAISPEVPSRWAASRHPFLHSSGAVQRDR